MSKTDQVIGLLNQLKDVLEKEKTVLIENDGAKLPKIIQDKEDIMISLSVFNEGDVEMDKLSVLSREVKALQETNLMLTEQSLRFTETMLEHIKKAAKQNNTYSKKGTFDDTKKSTLLDQSL
ncbi:flagellar export chaperone FlgN [Alkalibacterium olivapovliticus]|uniref:FlgN protein n=1 Tax=Alkalibacterium olivapovliticus TaxID=99907 RepID=A0A2T0VYW2_9LACT|nr:flagellar export chaperone FlgN [Alkalibacterium olivapovliticus]PRY77489.1 FlgN protein [Alkalibacterium olivapovliticus]